MVDIIYKLIICHLLGDYFLQIDFISHSKGSNWYHLFVHCALYTLPFYITFGLTWQLQIIFIMHLLVDASKARYNYIGYVTDQVLHYLVTLVYFL